jgi:uncharacterized protein
LFFEKAKLCLFERLFLKNSSFVINTTLLDTMIANIDENKIVTSTQQWLKEVVIACNFCPFAAKEMLQNRIRYQVQKDDDLNACAEKILAELTFLDENADAETTLLIFPKGFEDFEDFLDLLDIAEGIIEYHDYAGIYQIASFHPNYLFEGSSEDDPANYTNRSPFPTLHFLRESSLEKAIEAHPNTEEIPERNIRFAQEKGLDFMKNLLSLIKN